MITYDYHCDANGETITVSHSIKDTLTTWGQLCSIGQSSHGTDSPAHPDSPAHFLPGIGTGRIHSFHVLKTQNQRWQLRLLLNQRNFQ